MKKKKQNKFADIAINGIYLIAFAVCGFLIGMETEGLAGFDAILMFVLLFLLTFLSAVIQIIVHEGGHLVFGLLTGYKFKSFNVFGFIIIKKDGKLSVHRQNIAGMGGQCLMIPPEMKDGKIPVFIYNYGGVFLNLIVSAVTLCLYLFLPHIRFLSPFLLYMTITGCAFALANGIPLKGSLITNDGYNAFSLRHDKESLRGLWVQLMANAYSVDGKSTAEMPEEWFEIPDDEQMKKPMVAPIGVMACGRMMEEHRFEDADALLSHFLEIESGIVGLHKNLMICDRIYIELISRNRKDVVNGYLTKEQKNFMKAMKNYPSVIRTEYAYALLCKEDEEQGEKIQKQFEKCAKTYPLSSDIKTERGLMQLAYDAK